MKARLDEDFLNTAHFWFTDDLVQTNRRQGPLMAEAIQTRKYLNLWKEASSVENISISVNDGHDRVVPGQPPHLAPHSLALARGQGSTALSSAATVLKNSTSQPPKKPGDLDELSKLFARAIARSTPRGWDSPMFSFWFVASRLTRLAPDRLRVARGLASIRWKDGTDWVSPRKYRLEGGLQLPPLPGE
jgi:hypothetical protein